MLSVLFPRAADASALIVESQNGKVGDIVSVTLKISSVSLGAITVNIDYDNNVLEFQDAMIGAEGKKFEYSSANKVVNKAQVRFSGSVAGIENISVDGVLMTVNFKILSDTENIMLTAQASAYKADYSKVSITSANGEIKITDADTNIKISPTDKIFTADELMLQYKNQSNTVVIKNIVGNVISGVKKVGTGSRVVINNTVEIPIIVMSDLNGDGERNADDYILCRDFSVGLVDLDSDCCLAADINEDGVVNAFDTALIDLITA